MTQTFAFSSEDSTPEEQEIRKEWQVICASGAGPVAHTLAVVLPLSYIHIHMCSIEFRATSIYTVTINHRILLTFISKNSIPEDIGKCYNIFIHYVQKLSRSHLHSKIVSLC